MASKVIAPKPVDLVALERDLAQAMHRAGRRVLVAHGVLPKR